MDNLGDTRKQVYLGSRNRSALWLIFCATYKYTHQLNNFTVNLNPKTLTVTVTGGLLSVDGGL